MTEFRPILPCPRCGDPNGVHAEAKVFVAVGPGLSGFAPQNANMDNLFVSDDAYAMCLSCAWFGTAGDVRA